MAHEEGALGVAQPENHDGPNRTGQASSDDDPRPIPTDGGSQFEDVAITAEIPKPLRDAIRALSKRTGLSQRRLIREALHKLLTERDELLQRWEAHGTELDEREAALAREQEGASRSMAKNG